MTLHSRPIRDYMTLLPHTIGVTQTLLEAQQLMRNLRVRHLPVMEDRTTLVGVLSERDVVVAQALGTHLDKTAVGVAMTAGPFVVPPDAELTHVARSMAKQKVGCALVEEGSKVIGILTTTDGLSLLADVVACGGMLEPQSRLPSEVRQRILDEHKLLREMLEKVEQLSDDALREVLSDEEALHVAARDLYDMLLEHLELEDALLAPKLRESPTFGPRQAEALETKHHEQREQLQMGRAMLDAGDVEHLAESLLLLSHWVRVDMREEEATVLSPGALHDEAAQPDVAAG